MSFSERPTPLGRCPTSLRTKSLAELHLVLVMPFAECPSSTPEFRMGVGEEPGYNAGKEAKAT